MGARQVHQDMTKEGFSAELIMHCEHCVLSHHQKLEWGSPVVPATPEAFLVAHLDNISGWGVVYRDSEDGERQNSLNTTVFKYKE